MKEPFTAAPPSTVAPATLVELTDAMLDMVAGGSGNGGDNNGVGHQMGPMLRSAGGMSGMMQDKHMNGRDMGRMLGSAGGMKAAMTSGMMG